MARTPPKLEIWSEGGCVQGCTSGRPRPRTGRGRQSPRMHQSRPDKIAPRNARGDQVLRAQEDSNLRPLDPQSNALSRLSYGHLAHPRHTCFRRAFRQYRHCTHPGQTRRNSYGEGGIRTPGTLSGYNALAGRPIRPLSHLSLSSTPLDRHRMHRRIPLPSRGEEQGIRDRRGRDSNPRNRKRLNGFQDRLLRPLGHLSLDQNGRKASACSVSARRMTRAMPATHERTPKSTKAARRRPVRP